MTDFLYRFRSTEYLLGEYKELEKQEIFFSHPEQLNDPMEGYKDIFWQGDEIVWKNLLKHYVLCALQVCAVFSMSNEEKDVNPQDMPIFIRFEDLPGPYKDIYREVLNMFLQNEKIKRYPKYLSSLNQLIRRYELLYYLHSFHSYLINCVFSVFESKKIVEKRKNIQEIVSFCEKMILSSEHFDGINKFQDHIAVYQANEQIVLRLLSENHLFFKEKARRFVLLGFPDAYIKSLEKLIYHEWYAACFNSSCTNSSMWAHYANNHMGVCLKFKTQLNPQGIPFIGLQTIVGFGGNRGNTRLSSGRRNFEFRKVS